MKRHCLVLLALAAALSAQDPQRPHVHTNRKSNILLPLPKQEDVFHFAVFGDRTGGRPEGIKVLDQAVKDTNLLDPDLVMTVGDLIQGYGSTEAWMAEMKEFKASMSKLNMPWFPVAGNHDTYQREAKTRRLVGGHEDEYEQHFGPLWYWFAHKKSAFIVLFSDEGNPETREVSFGKPDCQRMSEAQFKWLKGALQKNKDKEHIFVFLHHPRWHKGRYGDDWDKVHKELVKTGNVRAVFAGHIHHIVYGGKVDGIEYMTLATTGGNVNLNLPGQAGYLHHYNIVTVRKTGISVATVPVGAVIDPRQIDKQVSAEVRDLHGRLSARGTRPLVVQLDGRVDGSYTATVRNPCSRPIDVTLVPETMDPRWSFGPDHQHAMIPPGESRKLSFKVRRSGSGLDEFFLLPKLKIQCDYLAKGMRISLQERRVDIAARPELGAPQAVPANAKRSGAGFLRLGRRGYLTSLAPQRRAAFIAEPFTVECYVRGQDLSGRRNIAWHPTFGLAIDEGSLSLRIGPGRSRQRLSSGEAKLQQGRWHHVAAVVGTEKIRLYLDGRQVATAALRLKQRSAEGNLDIGHGRGRRQRRENFAGVDLDEVRISGGARYEAARIEVPGRDEGLRVDSQTRMLLDFERKFGPWVEERATGQHLRRQGGAQRVAR